MELAEGDPAPRFADAPTSGGGFATAAEVDPFSIIYFCTCLLTPLPCPRPICIIPSV
jgi:hypothetical protein